LDPAPGPIAALVAAAFVAGVVDAIAGGGGLITLPALIWAGLPPELALGTNKGQSVFGSFAAMTRYGRAGLLDKPRARRTFPAALVGATLGALLVAFEVPRDALKPVILALLVAVAVFLFVRPTTLVPTGAPPKRPVLVAVGVAAVVGAYDGFFGPGTGTFLILAFVLWLKDSARQASADAKVVNFASNLASVIVFAFCGWVSWRVALPMAAAQFAGGAVGAHVTVRGGDVVVRRVVPVVVVAVAVKLAWDLLAA
jgi:uncharacterized membrane protein YfcA